MTALAAIENEPGVEIINGMNPQMVTIDTAEDRAASIAAKLAATHILEPEVRRGLD